MKNEKQVYVRKTFLKRINHVQHIWCILQLKDFRKLTRDKYKR